jgi:predicted N-formylglutamate amidohydrolase
MKTSMNDETKRPDVMTGLLGPDDPEAVAVENPAGRSPILFISDHAGRAIPRRLGNLGIGETELDRHIGWDIGIRGVTSILSDRLGATYIYQRYSRLVIDCNRRAGSAQSIMARSDGTEVPGNRGLTASEKRARDVEILRPYHACIRQTLDRRRDESRPTVIFAMHSCTPRLGSDAAPRPWHVGIIAHSDWRIGDSLIEILKTETDLCVGRNEPYSVNMAMDYPVPVHCEGRGLPYVEIEIRQDLIGDEAGQRQWAELLCKILPRVVERSGVLAA